MFGIETSQLQFLLLLLFLSVAALGDFKSRTIPNRLILLFWLSALIQQGVLNGYQGLVDALLGWALALLLFMPAHLAWGIGAGDVKLMAGVGLFLGPSLLLFAILCTVAVGGVIGMVILASRKGTLIFLQRHLETLRCLISSGHFVYIPPISTEAAAQRFPYAIAIFFGTLLALIFGTELY